MRPSPPRPRTSSRPLGRGLGVLMALLMALQALAQDAPRIAFVDMQRLLDSAPQVVEGRARLAREFAVDDARLAQDQRRLEQMEERLARDAVLMPPDEATLMRDEAAALRRSLERSRQRLNDELNARVQQELDRAWPQIEEAVAEYAREQGYDLVLPGPVIYASGRLDITDRVLDRLRLSVAREPPR